MKKVILCRCGCTYGVKDIVPKTCVNCGFNLHEALAVAMYFQPVIAPPAPLPPPVPLMHERLYAAVISFGNDIDIERTLVCSSESGSLEEGMAVCALEFLVGMQLVAMSEAEKYHEVHDGKNHRISSP